MAFIRSLNIWILAGILLAGPCLAMADNSSPAGETAPPALSLADARRIAFLNNWDLLAAKSDVDIARTG